MKPGLKKLLDLSLFFLSNVILNGTDVVTDAITAWGLCKQIINEILNIQNWALFSSSVNELEEKCMLFLNLVTSENIIKSLKYRLSMISSIFLSIHF